MHRHFEINDLQSSGLRLFSAARPLPKHHQARRLPARVDRAGHLVRVRVRARVRARVRVRVRDGVRVGARVRVRLPLPLTLTLTSAPASPR